MFFVLWLGLLIVLIDLILGLCFAGVFRLVVLHSWFSFLGLFVSVVLVVVSCSCLFG